MQLTDEVFMREAERGAVFGHPAMHGDGTVVLSYVGKRYQFLDSDGDPVPLYKALLDDQWYVKETAPGGCDTCHGRGSLRDGLGGVYECLMCHGTGVWPDCLYVASQNTQG